jgi:hypothetical protein
VTFAASYLTDHAQKHYITLLQHQAGHPATHNWADFVAEFGYMFGVVNIQVEAQQNLRLLTMREHERFSTFIIRFEENSYDSGWNDAALLFELYRALPPRLKDVLKTLPRSASVQELRDLAMSIDHRHWEHEDETRRNLGRPSWTPSGRTPGGKEVGESKPEAKENRSWRANMKEGKPSPVPGTHAATPGFIPQEERERRRREGLCFRCGEEGHIGAQCTKVPTVGRAIFTIDDNDVVEQFHEDADDPFDDQYGEAENAQAIQELPGTN